MSVTDEFKFIPSYRYLVSVIPLSHGEETFLRKLQAWLELTLPSPRLGVSKESVSGSEHSAPSPTAYSAVHGCVERVSGRICKAPESLQSSERF